MHTLAAPLAPVIVTTPGPRRALGALLLAEGLLALAPMAVLGPAIGWPASLSAPAATQLAAVAAAPQAVAGGYALYLLYSLLVAPLMILLAARTLGSLAQPLAASAAAFAVLSTGARAIGILRWLTVMPALAAAHAAAAPADRAAVEALFSAITAYGGGIGEVLGVSLFMAASLGLWAVGAWRRPSAAVAVPRPLLAVAGLVAVALAGMAGPALGLPVAVPTAVAVSGLSLWMMVAGLWLLARR